MVYTSKYLEKTDVLEMIKGQNPEATVDRLTDWYMMLVDAMVDNVLLENQLHPGSYVKYLASSCGTLLRCAAMFAALELACYQGWIEWTSGDIGMFQYQKFQKSYQRWQPMFFFARGMAKDFYALLPHQSYRMLYYDMIKNFQKCYKEYSGDVKQYALAIFGVDLTSRGWNWNLDTTYFDEADAESEEVG